MLLEETLDQIDMEHRRRITACLDLLHRQTIHSATLQGEVEALKKADSSPVTVVDLLHQAQVQQVLAAGFPGDGLVCEEPPELQRALLDRAVSLSKDVYSLELERRVVELPTSGRVTWVLDPIDGTKGFLGGRYFAIAIGYFVDGRPYFGALAVPGSNPSQPQRIDRAMAFAVHGHGAWIATAETTERAPCWRPLRSRPWSGGEIRVAVSLAHGGPLVDRLQQAASVQVVKLDSQAKYLAVATGDLDAYLRARRDDGLPDLVWDHMPGAVVAMESGCAVRQFGPQPLAFAPRAAVSFDGGVMCVRASAQQQLLASVVSLVGG